NRRRSAMAAQDGREATSPEGYQDDGAKPAGPRLALLPGWADRLRAVADHEASETEPARVLPRSPRYYAGKTTLVESAAGAGALLDLARQRPLAFIGFDTEFRYDRPGVAIDARHTAHDPRGVRPLLLSLALAEPADVLDTQLYGFVVDLRAPGVLPALADLL